MPGKHEQHITAIPGSLTSLLQPLYICLNTPLRDYVHALWNKQIFTTEKTFAKGEYIGTAQLDVLCDFMTKAWNDVK
jgi:hypothetical protein